MTGKSGTNAEYPNHRISVASGHPVLLTARVTLEEQIGKPVKTEKKRAAQVSTTHFLGSERSR